MKSIIIREGITLTATQSTIDAFKRELRTLEAEREAREYLATLTPADPEYSDVYKDVYGVRPRWLF